MRTFFALASLLLLAAGCPDAPSSDLDRDGWSESEGDCNDADPAVFPGAGELCDGIDNDCDQVADEGYDEDGDGFSRCGDGRADCDDDLPSVFPGAVELCNGIDDDCDGSVDEDEVCGPPETDDDEDGWTIEEGDCDDADAAVFPGAPERCNAEDDDCDDAVDETFDTDGDGVTTCGPDGAAGTADDDCNDGNASVYPGAAELCNGVDDNCAGGVDEGNACNDDDADGDGYTGNQGDCDDTDPDVFPGAWEQPDGIDNDCEGGVDEGYSGVVSLWAFTPTYAEGEERMGDSISPAGDIDGDGLSDLVVGSPLWNGGRGRAYVYFGRSYLPGNAPTEIEPDVVLVGAAVGDRFGHAVGLGDLNGDGHDDVIVGAPMIGSASPPPGRVYVFWGSPAFENSSTLGVESAGLTVTGAFPTEQCGTAVAAPDLDGDGEAELAVGCPWYNTAGGIRGRTAVFQGRPGWPAALDSDDAELRIVGAVADAYSGSALVALDNFTGSAADELAIGVPEWSNGAGRVVVVPGGPAAGVFTGAVDLGAYQPRYQANAGNHAGEFLGAGDLDGDGRTDLLVGAPQHASERGGLTVIYGAASASSSYLWTNFILQGDAAGDRMGESAAVVDLNGDGTPDLVGAASEADRWTGVDRGAVYIMDGPHAGWSGTRSPGAEQDATLLGANTGDGLGRAMAALPDFNGDGAEDLAVTAPYFGPGNEGRLYIVPGF